MQTDPDLLIEVEASIDDAIEALESSIRKPAIGGRIVAPRVHLGGSIDPPRITLFRHRGGSFSYVTFKGLLSDIDGGVRLAGSIEATDSALVHVVATFAGVICFVCLLGVVFAPGIDSKLVSAVFGFSVVGLAILVRRFRRLNEHAERQLLVDDIGDVLSNFGRE